MTDETQLPVWAEWAKAIGPVLASSLAVLVSTMSFYLSRQIARWQAAVARETIRQNYFDRRFAIFLAFRELLVAIVEKDDVEDELRKANAARAAAPFLLDKELEEYLENLHHDTFKVNASHKLVAGNVDSMTQDQLIHFASYKLELARRLSDLTQRFEPFLRPEDPQLPSFSARFATLTDSQTTVAPDLP